MERKSANKSKRESEREDTGKPKLDRRMKYNFRSWVSGVEVRVWEVLRKICRARVREKE